MDCDYCKNEIKPSKGKNNTGGRFTVVKETISMPFNCRRCGGSFCTKHRLPENHDCVGLKPPIIIDLKHINIEAKTPIDELNDLEKIRRIKTSMLNDTQGKNERTRLLNELYILDKEIDFIKESLDIKKESTPVFENKTNHICQFCFKSFEQSWKCQKCGLDLCQDHIFNHSCIKALLVDPWNAIDVIPKKPKKQNKIKDIITKKQYYRRKHLLRKIFYTPYNAVKNILSVITKITIALFLLSLIILFYFDNNELNYEIDNTINNAIDSKINLDVDINKTSHNAVIYEDGIETYYVGGDGHEIYLQNNPNATNPTYNELIIFLKNDKTDLIQYTDNFVCADFAERVHNNAEESGIRAAWVSLDFSDNDDGHALNAFYTVDNGLVFTDSTGSIEPTPCGYDRKIGIEIGKHIWTYKLYDCTEDYYYLLPSSKVKEVKIFW